jgi:ubiquinone/menaquinone biosynthesis C-methylase UbiE
MLRIRWPPATDRPVSVIDVAGGTGDIAFRLAAAMRAANVRCATEPEIVVTDINEGMLNVGQQRAVAKGFATGDLVGFAFFSFTYRTRH